MEAHLGRYADTQRDPFCALNTAFIGDGAYVHVARGVVVDAPIYLLYLSTKENAPTMTHPRNLIVAEDQSQVAVIEDYASVGGESVVFSNAVTELIAGESTVAQHYLIEREHLKAFNVQTLRIQQGRSANVASHSVLLGGGLVRNNVHPVLAGEGGECLINGLFMGTGRQHLDNYMHVEHAAPHCGSRQFYNGILDGHAHGVFHGRIVVHKAAQKTDAKQTNRNLLLSDDAQIDTKPQLEIYADDVKCTHGATIGQIEENALFYLQSRGISELEARKLLLMAFAEECVDRMHSTVAREHIAAAGEPTFAVHRRHYATGRDGPVELERIAGGSGMSAAAAVPIRERAAVQQPFDVERIRKDFPILHTKVHGHPLVYLDNAATSQKPRSVIDALVRYYEGENANIHRGVHYLSQIATEEFEKARETVRAFVNAAQASEIIFTRGTTEAINLVAQTYGRAHVGCGR